MTRFYAHLEPRWLVAAGLALFGLILVRTAWVCDDAFITFRVADNWLAGHGLRWNVVERVQAYTNPLWLFVVTPFYGLSGELFYTAIFLSITISIAAVALLLLHCAPDRYAGLLMLALLLASKAFVDFSTSGLENPLSHLLLALFLWHYLVRPADGQNLLRLALIAGLALCNRMDSLLLLGPSLLWAAHLAGWQSALPRLALGLSPFLLWELFALAYYGFPFPNTAYAKLNTGIPALELAAQGGRYLLNSLYLDPLTPAALAAAIIWALWRRQRETALAIGLVLHLLYVVKVGGDFMSGRFLAAPFFVAVALLGRATPWPERQRALLIALTAVALGGSAGHFPTLLTGSDFSHKKGDDLYLRVTDQRLSYYADCGLLPALAAPAGRPFPTDQMAAGGRHIRRGRYSAVKSQGFLLSQVKDSDRLVGTWVAVGFIGFFAGPQLHLVDAYALGDPLLARLPARQQEDWIAGHFLRILPEGYWETQHSDQNQIADPKLSRLYDRLIAVARAPLWSAERWREIWRFNSGAYADLVDFDAYRHPSDLDAALADARIKRDPGRFIKIARQYFKTGQIERGAEALQTAIELNPTSALNYAVAGSLLDQNGRQDQAGPLFAKAVELTPAYLKEMHRRTAPDDRFVPYIDLSVAFEAVQKLEDALDLVRRAAALRPESVSASASLGRLHFNAGRLDSASVHLERTTRLAPDNPNHYIHYGYMLKSLGRLEEAITAYQKAIERQPDTAKFHYYLGTAHRAKGDTTAAIAALERAVDLGPEDGHPYLALADLHKAQNRPQQALAVYRRLVDTAPPGAPGKDLAAAGAALFVADALDQAIDAYQMALERDPSLNWVRINLGWCLYRRGDLDQAIDIYQQALAKDPHPVAHFNLALALLHRGDVARAEQTYAAAIGRFGANTGRRIGAEADLRRLAAAEVHTTVAKRILRTHWGKN